MSVAAAADEADTDVIEVPDPPKPPMEGPHVFEAHTLHRLADVLQETSRVQRETNQVLRELRDELQLHREHDARFEDLLERFLQSLHVTRSA